MVDRSVRGLLSTVGLHLVRGDPVVIIAASAVAVVHVRHTDSRVVLFYLFLTVTLEHELVSVIPVDVIVRNDLHHGTVPRDDLAVRLDRCFGNQFVTVHHFAGYFLVSHTSTEIRYRLNG